MFIVLTIYTETSDCLSGWRLNTKGLNIITNELLVVRFLIFHVFNLCYCFGKSLLLVSQGYNSVLYFSLVSQEIFVRYTLVIWAKSAIYHLRGKMPFCHSSPRIGMLITLLSLYMCAEHLWI